jgi:hypothetical protein
VTQSHFLLAKDNDLIFFPLFRLYPVDQSRIDHGTSIEESAELLPSEDNAVVATSTISPTKADSKKNK